MVRQRMSLVLKSYDIFYLPVSTP